MVMLQLNIKGSLIAVFLLFSTTPIISRFQKQKGNFDPFQTTLNYLPQCSVK